MMCHLDGVDSQMPKKKEHMLAAYNNDVIANYRKFLQKLSSYLQTNTLAVSSS